MGVGRSLRGRTLGLYGYGRIAKALADYAGVFGMNVVWWASEAGRARAKADGANVAESRVGVFQQPRHYQPAHSPKTRYDRCHYGDGFEPDAA